MNFSETSTELFQADDNTRLLTYIWMPKAAPRAIFIAIHGGMAHAGDWVTPALYFMKKGIATYAPDLRWHGTFPKYNPGGKVMFHIDSYDQYCGDVDRFCKWVAAKHPGVPMFLVGHSNGALISLYYGLTAGRDADLKGVVISSPWLKNKVEVSPILLALSKVLSKVAPTLAVVPEPLTEKLTHDRNITARHYADEAAGLRGTKATVRLGAESIKTQEWVVEHMAEWKRFPVFAAIAGQDMLADPGVSETALGKMSAELLTLHRYNENYHENFNEVNREKIYALIAEWCDTRLKGAAKKAAAKPKGASKPKAKSKAKPKKRK
ncbi:MAG: alpha/beta fold hydrolase [Spirochaetes bacterium]|nr:alpha/beta fold hydrolase [Spirochaetota bacterium]